MGRLQQIADAFSAAASTYDSAAQAQICAAHRLTRLVRETAPALSHPSVLEVGCGTGLLTRLLLPALGGSWLVTDISAAMMQTTRASLPEGAAQYRVMDGQQPDIPAASVDVVVSNLAAQWFDDLPQAIARLRQCLHPGGMLALSTLGRGSFVEWRQALEQAGLPCGIPVYPTAQELAAALPRGGKVRSESVVVRHSDAYDFLAALKRIGAGTPVPGHRPIPAGALRAIMRRLGAPLYISYEILYVTCGA